MRKIKVFIAVLVTVAAGGVQAAASVYAEIDWSGMTYSTTGSLTFSLVALPIMDARNSLVLQSTEDDLLLRGNSDGTLLYSQPDLSADLVNTATHQHTSVTSEPKDYVLAYTRSVSLITVSGAGSATFSIPYEYHLTMGDDVHATGYISAWGDQGLYFGPMFNDRSAVSPWPSLNYGTADRVGMITYTIFNQGGVKSTQFTVDAGAILTSVPEPETYAMIGLGVGAIWLARRRKAAGGMGRSGAGMATPGKPFA